MSGVGGGTQEAGDGSTGVEKSARDEKREVRNKDKWR